MQNVKRGDVGGGEWSITARWDVELGAVLNRIWIEVDTLISVAWSRRVEWGTPGTFRFAVAACKCQGSRVQN